MYRRLVHASLLVLLVVFAVWSIFVDSLVIYSCVILCVSGVRNRPPAPGEAHQLEGSDRPVDDLRPHDLLLLLAWYVVENIRLPVGDL